MNQLRQEHGTDLIFAELHLDEDTPHIHAVVAPTYLKKARVPGKQKRGETSKQFEERRTLARSSEGVRTVGRASHPTLSKKGSFQRLRERMSVAVDHLGIEYGEDRATDAPEGQSTREWVIQQAVEIREERLRLFQERAQFEAEQEKAQADLEKTVAWVERGVRNLSVSIDRVQAGTYDTELSSVDMHDTPKKFEILKDAAPDKRPTLGFRARFWALNFSDGSGPAPLPDKIRTGLTKAFDRVATWASEVRQGRRVIHAAEQTNNSLETKNAIIQQWRSYTVVIKDKIREHLGDDGYQLIADSVNDAWKEHDDNPNQLLPEFVPDFMKSMDSGPRGPTS